MHVFSNRMSLLAMAGAALLVSGCATVDDVNKAQGTADQAMSAAQHAQGTADQALSAAQSAQQSIDQVRSDVDALKARHRGERG